MVYAGKAKDSAALEWAAGNLARQDWPVNNTDIQYRVSPERIKEAAVEISGAERQAEIERLLKVIQAKRQRDMVIKLRWDGDADLSLKVKEPCGSTCSFMSRQTIGGATMLPGNRAEPKSETYVASEAFSGEYAVTIDRLYGKPLGDKATIEITRYLGTPKEHTRIETVDFRLGNTLTVQLDDGRRQTAADVPPPSAVEQPKEETAQPSSMNILRQLRDMADPVVTGFEPGMKGTLGGLGAITDPKDDPRNKQRSLGNLPTYQTRVAPIFNNSFDLTAQAIISGDGTSVRLSLSPVFTGVTRTRLQPVVINPLVPSGFKPSGLN
jgi:hypothetical protein